MDDIILKAQSRLKEIEAEAQKLRNFLEVAESLSSAPPRPVVKPELVKTHRAPAPGSLVYQTAEAARSAIVAAGQPVLLRDLVECVRARGVAVSGQSPTATLSARLSNSKQFISRRTAGWWPKDLPLPSGFEWMAKKESVGEPSSTPTDPKVNSDAKGGDNDATTLNTLE